MHGISSPLRQSATASFAEVVMKRHARLLFSMLVLVTLVACGGGQKRPPVVASQPTPAPPVAPTAAPGATGSVDYGPDVQAVEDDYALGESALGTDAMGGNGPLGDIFFGLDRATLSPEAEAGLRGHARWLAQNPGSRVVIEGHCDDRGTVEYNLALGDQRARVAMEYLVSLGVDLERLTTVSYGKERPKSLEGNEAGWAQNRRAHFVVTR